MSGQLSIKVVNNSAVMKNFFIFADKPKISGSTSGVLQPYFMKSSVNSKGGEATFTFQNDLYAVVGNALVEADSSITQADFSKKPVTLGVIEDDSLSPGSYYPATVKSGTMALGAEEKKSPVGAYTIKCKPDFDQGSTYFVGLARKTNKGTIVPVAVKTAVPNSTMNIIPNVTFYVTTAEYEEGKLFDIMVTGTDQEIDFTGGKTEATVTYSSKGTYTISLSSSS